MRLRIEDRETFAARRKPMLRRAEARLVTVVAESLLDYGTMRWWAPILDVARDIWTETFHEEYPGDTPVLQHRLDDFLDDLDSALAQTKEPSTATRDRIVRWASTAAINSATVTAGESETGVDLVSEWVDMNDEDVRPTHVEADGQVVPFGGRFLVGEATLRFPGDPLGPPEEILNCRCVLRLDLGEPVTTTTFTATAPTVTATDTFALPVKEKEPDADDAQREVEVEDEPQDGDEDDPTKKPLPFTAVLCPEGVRSGDGRQFAPQSLNWRDLPLPLSWQRVNAERHDGSTVVGHISDIERDETGETPLIRAKGVFNDTPEAGEVVTLIANGDVRGISVDVDDAEMDLNDDAEVVELTKGRICGSTIVPIPAFAEAFILIGDSIEDRHSEDESAEFASDKPWSQFPASAYTPEQWHNACLVHLHTGAPQSKSECKLPVKEPGGALNRNGVHAAAGRLNQTQAPPEKIASAKSKLRGLYRQLGEEPPDSLKAQASPDDFAVQEWLKRGPGWVTHPVETRRLHRYWTRGEGAAKIGWGRGGDFNRCRTQLAEYIRPDLLNQVCAQWHHDALGIWPGEHVASADTTGGSALTLVAGGNVGNGPSVAPSRQWFDDPGLPGVTPLTVTDEGRVYGHLASWKDPITGEQTCHIGIPGVCVTPPHSEAGYAYFHTGVADTDQGQIPAGRITLGTGHAGRLARPRPAVEHYDNSGTMVAKVRAGEDAHGIWVAGALRSDATPQQIETLRMTPLSGDWRELGGHIELVAALAVNTGGFPVPRVGVGISNGAQVSLVAAGVIDPALYAVEQFAANVNAVLDAREAKAAMSALVTAHNRARMNALVAERR